MRVLLLGDTSSPHLAVWHDALVAAGAEVCTGGLEPPLAGREYVQLPNFRGKARYLLAARGAKSLVRRFAPDVVFAHYLPNYGLIGALVAGSRPLALCVWGSDLLETPRKSPLHARATEWIVSRANAIVCDAALVANLLTERYGFPHERVLTFPFGPEEALLTREPAPKPTAPPWRFLCTRKLSREYGHNVLLVAFRQLIREEDARLVIASGGRRRRAIAKTIEAFGLGERVRLTGWLDRTALVEEYERAHLFVSPSFTDATPVSLLEAMALSCVPVVSDLPATREWVLDGETGFTCDPRSATSLARAMKRAIAAKDEHESIRAANRRVVRARCRFGGDVRRTLALLERLREGERVHLRPNKRFAVWSFTRGHGLGD